MVVTLVLTGVSYRVDLYDLALHLNRLLNANEIGTCRMRALPNHHRTNKRQIGLEFDSGFEAMPAQDLLNGYDYVASDGVIYKIQAKISSESTMSYSLDSIEDFEREIYEFSMSDLLKSPKRSPQRNHRMPIVKYKPGNERVDDRRKRRSRSPAPRSVVKMRKCEPRQSKTRRHKSPSPSYSKKKKDKKSKKLSKLKRKEEKKLEKMKKKKRKRKTSSDSSSEQSSNDREVHLQKHRKQHKKTKETEDNYKSNLLRECKILEQRLNKIQASKSKGSETLCREETNILKHNLIPEDIKTENNKLVNQESEDVYVWSDESCDGKNETSKQVHAKNTSRKDSRTSNEILSKLKDSKNLERCSKTLENSIERVARSSLQDSNINNVKHKTNESEMDTLTSSTHKNTQSSDVLDKNFERFDSNKLSDDKRNLNDIITLTYDEFEKENQSKVIKSEPIDEIEKEKIESESQGIPKLDIVIKSEPKDNIENENATSVLQPISNSVVIKSEPIDETNTEELNSQLQFTIESIVIKSEPNNEMENEKTHLEHNMNIKEEPTIHVDDYDSESTLELELGSDVIPSCDQKESAVSSKHKEDDLKIWDVLDEVLQDIPSDIF